ncbi:phosphate transport regulator [Ferrigenium kumadai]|uniref:Phosphate transport regulator n=1 Tax=Ferrigenium kumadai TaxID=1682490 RepID=A0AAN1SY06_9PROT|nr:DUF47 family protein [Ferrigenium kumadai]BBI98982.1 phosphate transport regulator [Ferrigenium kumadai]
MIEASKTILAMILDRVFPKVPDFFHMLTEQNIKVAHTVNLLVEYMEYGDPVVADALKQNVQEADEIKVRNLHELNEAFSTPIDREDIYRAIMALDDIVMYCKTTVHEMDVLAVTPDDFMRNISHCIKEGVDALANGFAKLATTPATAALDADAARKAERHAEKLYRAALPILFEGTDYINMFKRREIYRHLTNAAQHMALCANRLHDIVVKIS